MELTITVSAFRALVEPVLPMASSDDLLPVFNAIHFTAQDGALMAEATDRFVMGITRRQHDGAPDGLDWLVEAADVRAILRVFRARRGSDPTLTLTASDGVLWVESQEQGALIDFVGARVGYRLEVGEFPRLRSLVRKFYDAGVVSEPTSYDTGFLAKFKVLGREGVTFRPGGEGVTIITRHEDGALNFVGAIMGRRPVRGAEGDLWPELTPAEAKAVA